MHYISLIYYRCTCNFAFYLQFVILVVDSTDRERLGISKEELYHMLACEVIFTIYSVFVIGNVYRLVSIV